MSGSLDLLLLFSHIHLSIHASLPVQSTSAAASRGSQVRVHMWTNTFLNERDVKRKKGLGHWPKTQFLLQNATIFYF